VAGRAAYAAQDTSLPEPQRKKKVAAIRRQIKNRGRKKMKPKQKTPKL
jgi:hypothetical protein